MYVDYNHSRECQRRAFIVVARRGGRACYAEEGKEATEQCGNINGDGKNIDSLSKMSLQHLIFIVVVWRDSVPISVYELWEVDRGGDQALPSSLLYRIPVLIVKY